MWGCRTLALVDWVAASIRDCTLLFSGRELALRPVQQLFMVFMDFPAPVGFCAIRQVSPGPTVFAISAPRPIVSSNSCSCWTKILARSSPEPSRRIARQLEMAHEVRLRSRGDRDQAKRNGYSLRPLKCVSGYTSKGQLLHSGKFRT